MDDSFFTPVKDSNKSKSSSSSDGNKKPKPVIPRLISDKLEVGDALRGAHLECPVCRKSLETLSEIRRAIHVNSCVDSSANKKAVEEATKQSQTMFTCSFCHEGVAKGPYLIAHANKCSKTFDIPVKQMISALETQCKVAEQLRKNGFQKAVPVTTDMIKKAKKRALEEGDARKSSESDLTPPLKKPSTSGQKFTSGLLKSTVFGAKEKRTCRCEGLHAIQSRFCSQFKQKASPKDDRINKDILEKNVFTKKLAKIDRLSRLADDLRKNLFSQKGDIKLLTKDGLSLSAHSFVLKARTSMVIKPDTTEVSLTDFSNEVVEYYLFYVYSGAIEWSMVEMEDIKKLASLYGPTDLYLMMNQSDDVFNNPAEELFLDDNAYLDDQLVMAEEMNQREEEEDMIFTQKGVVTFDTNEKVNETLAPPPSDSFYNDDFSFCGQPPQPLLQQQQDDSIIEIPMQQPVSEIPKEDFVFENPKEDSIVEVIPIEKPAKKKETPEKKKKKDIEIPKENPAPKLSKKKPTVEFTTPQEKQKEALTESGKTRRIAAKFGSGVKVIKVNDVTPMPQYEKFSDDDLKDALKQFGLRPMGRKKAIEMLKNIYEEVHPFVPDLTAATPKRRPSPIPFDLEQATSSESSSSVNEMENSDDVLNRSLEENPEESLFFDADETIGTSGAENSPTKGLKRINDVETGVKAMLEWLRLPENEEVYCDLLRFNTINLDELMGRMARATHAVKKITKKILPDVLDKLYIGFYVPDKKWKRRAGYKSG